MRHNGDMAESESTVQEALLPGRVGLFVRLAANPGGRPALLDALNRYSDTLDSELDTEMFLISLDPEDADVVWIYEWFSNEEGLQRHQAGNSFADLVREVPDLLAGPPGMLRVDPLRIHMKTDLFDESVDIDS